MANKNKHYLFRVTTNDFSEEGMKYIHKNHNILGREDGHFCQLLIMCWENNTISTNQREFTEKRVTSFSGANVFFSLSNISFNGGALCMENARLVTLWSVDLSIHSKISPMYKVWQQREMLLYTLCSSKGSNNASVSKSWLVINQRQA